MGLGGGMETPMSCTPLRSGPPKPGTATSELHPPFIRSRPMGTDQAAEPLTQPSGAQRLVPVLGTGGGAEDRPAPQFPHV